MLLLDHQFILTSDFLFHKKLEKYTFKRKEMVSVILRMIVDTEIFNNKMVRVMPISIKEAYYEYYYGIFLNKLT